MKTVMSVPKRIWTVALVLVAMLTSCEGGGGSTAPWEFCLEPPCSLPDTPYPWGDYLGYTWGRYTLTSVTRFDFDGTGSMLVHPLPERVPLLEYGGRQVWVVADTVWIGDDSADPTHVQGLYCRSATTLRVDSGGTQRTQHIDQQGTCPWGYGGGIGHSAVLYSHFFADLGTVPIRGQTGVQTSDKRIAEVWISSEIGSTKSKDWRYVATAPP